MVTWQWYAFLEITTEVVVWRCSVKKVFLEISQNSQENICARISFLIKLQSSGLQLYKKRGSDTVFSCKFCEISKNTFSHRTPPVAASVRNPKPIETWEQK